MSTHDPAPRERRPGHRGCGRRLEVCAVALLALTATLAACGDGGGSVDEVRDARDGPNPGVVPTMVGGVDLGSLDPTTVLVGAELTFGSPLPSEQAAAEAYLTDPEVSAAIARRVFVAADGRHLADVAVLVLNGAELFDESVLAAFVHGAVSAAGGGPAAEVPVAGQTVLRAADPSGAVVAAGFREANLLVIVTGPSGPDVDLTVTRQLEARARGEVGSPTPVTPLVALPVGAAFIPVPTVGFAPIPPPEEEPPPEAPGLSGAIALEGRYGVVAGERRALVWAFAVDPGAYPSAEALDPALQGLAAARAGGTAPAVSEVGGRVVYAASNAPGTRSAQVFRHGGLVLLVEGNDAAQLDAVTTAWIAALPPG